MNSSGPNTQYWAEYSNLQRVKHDLIKKYLDGWFPKMTQGPARSKRLLYIDTHAGRGKHLTGELGSPLVALTTLLGHTARGRILETAEVAFHFLERDTANVAALKTELTSYPLPQNVSVYPESGDGFQIIEDTIRNLKKGGIMPPAFIFLDPFGFKLPGQLLQQLMKYPKVELFINVMWRELDLAICNVQADNTLPVVPRSLSLFDDGEIDDLSTAVSVANKAGLETTLKRVFDGDRWRSIRAKNADDRGDECATLFKELTGARWGTHLRMMDGFDTKYPTLDVSPYS